MLASIPASTLNQNPADLGIPNRFNSNESDSKGQKRTLGTLVRLSAFLPKPDFVKRPFRPLFVHCAPELEETDSMFAEIDFVIDNCSRSFALASSAR